MAPQTAPVLWVDTTREPVPTVFHTVQAAIDAAVALKHLRQPVTVHLAPGVYNEQVTIPRRAGPIILKGEKGREPRISFGAHSGKRRAGAQGSGDKEEDAYNTYTSCTVAVESHDFTAVDVVFENSAAQNCGGASGQHQAVAVRVTADRASFYDCAFLSWQDTLYAHSGSAFFSSCHVAGSVDFVFGGPHMKAYLLGCSLHFRDRGWLTAHQRRLDKYPNDEGAFVFDHCCITAASTVKPGSVYLGRPWGQDARVVLHACFLPAAVNAAGWQTWNAHTDATRPTYLEDHCTGPGSIQEGTRRTMGRQPTQAEMAQWVPAGAFFKGLEPFPSLAAPQ